MRLINRITRLVFAVIVLLAVFSGCEKKANGNGELLKYTSFRDIPGITTDEIKAIEALQSQQAAFVYGMVPTTEAFIGEDGKVGGYSALFCQWLSQVFGLPFTVELYNWGDLLTGMESGAIDFSGDMTPNDERLESWFMTSAIAERPIKVFRLESEHQPFWEIVQERPIRCGFFGGSTNVDDVTSRLQGNYEVSLFYDFDTIYRKLKSGEIDAYFSEAPAEAGFDIYGDVVTTDFFPVVYSPVSFTTQKAELAPIISIVQKAMQHDGLHYLTSLYNQGYSDYRKHKLFKRLTDEEQEYIRDRAVVLVAAEYENYPMSFYDARKKQWDGAIFETFRELEALTGLSFAVANDPYTEWPDLLKMLEDGEVSLVTELIRSKERKGRFLWPESTILHDNFILLSKLDYENININEILYVKVGLPKDTAYAEMFREWFPHHMNTVEYDSTNLVLKALERNEVDMIMSSQHQLMLLTNFREIPGYKANIVFDYAFESTPGFNLREEVLCSIVDKALDLIDTNAIAGHWLRRTYDYRIKIAEERAAWIVGAVVLLSLSVFFLILFQRNRLIGLRLEKLVKKRTNELALQTTTLTATFDAIPDFIFCKDTNFCYTRCNKSFENYFGLREENIIGKNDAEGLRATPEQVAFYNKYDNKVITENKIYVIDEELPAPDGGSQLYETIKVPLVQKGVVTGLLGVSRNITQRKAMEEQALSASRAKSAFLANMSHEIRTPLNAIAGMTTIGMSADDTDRKDYCFTKIQDASAHLLGVINDILDMSKIEAGKFDLCPVEFNFEKVIRNAADIMSFRVNEKHQKFELRLDKNIPEILIADDQRLAQVITNLLGNAIKFTPERGEVSLSAQFLEEKDGVCTIEVAIKDTGIGISAEQLNLLFTSFQQAENSTTRKYGGTGLGLAISKSIVEQMGGIIRVDSALGKGSTFAFTIQAQRVAASAENTPSDSPPTDVVSFEGRHILLADDVEINREIVLAMLEPMQLAIDCAVNGADALRKFSAVPEKYDMIFMDVQMPEMDGCEATRRIRELDCARAKSIPIIAMTANVFREDIEKYIEVGMNGHVGKPLDINEVLATLQTYLPKGNEG